MTTPTKYKSGFSGAEIERLLQSIPGKLDAAGIVNDFLGGEDKIASAELAKILNDRIDDIIDPEYLKNLLIGIPDNNLFTDAEKAKLQGIDADSFKGVFANAAARTSALNTAGFTGKEITFLLDDGTGLQSWDYWHTASSTWKKSKLINLGDVNPISLPTIGTTTFSTFNKTVYTGAEVFLIATKGTQYQSMKMIVGTNGTDTYMSSYAELGNASLMDVLVTMSGNDVNLQVTTLTTGVTLKAKKIAEF